MADERRRDWRERNNRYSVAPLLTSRLAAPQNLTEICEVFLLPKPDFYFSNCCALFVMFDCKIYYIQSAGLPVAFG